MTTVSIEVPGTTANLGAGFDCIGAALTIYNRFTFTLAEVTTITVVGKEANRVGTDHNNLAYQSFLKLYQHLEQTPPAVAIKIDLGIPLARGLGSSATAIVGGLLGANYLAGNPLSLPEVMDLGIEIEGHPDNVVPAFLGKCQLSVGSGKKWTIAEIPWHGDIIPVVAIPNFELSTEAARSVLPKEISRADAIFNIAHLGLLLRGLAENNPDWLRVSLDDRLHQPYRQSLIKGYQNVSQASIEAGAYGMVISGAGPTLLALTDVPRQDRVVQAMFEAWQQEGIEADVRPLTLDIQGAKVCQL
jgi:homoserine kinase